MTDQHTDYVLEEHGFEMALRFHLSGRVFPPRPEMYATAELAIVACNEGDPDLLVDLPDGVYFRGDDKAPAREIITGLNLWSFIDD